jgi:hypothetical protein
MEGEPTKQKTLVPKSLSTNRHISKFGYIHNLQGRLNSKHYEDFKNVILHLHPIAKNLFIPLNDDNKEWNFFKYIYLTRPQVPF